MLILHLSALGTAPSWGVHLQKKGGRMKTFCRWWTGVRRERALLDSPPDQLRCSHLHSQISPSAESHWCHSITFNYESTSSHSLVHPLPHCLQSTALQPWVLATGGFKGARLYKELAIFSWNSPCHNVERCHILGASFPACICRKRSLWLSFPSLSPRTILHHGWGIKCRGLHWKAVWVGRVQWELGDSSPTYCEVLVKLGWGRDSRLFLKSFLE